MKLSDGSFIFVFTDIRFCFMYLILFSAFLSAEYLFQ
jgi:hypothetical protein